MQKIAITTLFALLLILGLASIAPAATTPTQRVQEGVEALIGVLNSPQASDPAQHDEMITKLRGIADKFIAWDEVTKLCVGKPWLSMDPQMRQDMIEAFIQLLERTYLKRIPVYDNQTVNYLKELISGNRAKVLTEIVTTDKKLTVEFRLKEIGGQWMIYDVIGEGVSLVKNYRTQFNEILHQGTPADLLQKIRDRVQELDAESSGANS